jgi:hypothetical protein
MPDRKSHGVQSRYKSLEWLDIGWLISIRHSTPAVGHHKAQHRLQIGLAFPSGSFGGTMSQHSGI